MGVLRSALNLYSKMSPKRGQTKPPYKHIIQVGDPILRRISSPVAINEIKSELIHSTINNLKYTINVYRSLGMSAPQIGINLRIFAMQLTEKQLRNIDPSEISTRQITSVPFTVFVNPTLKILDYTKISFIEGCESVKGYAAEVPRYKAVEVAGLNENGEEQTRTYEGWSARIVQHEFDHLDGKIYIDTMDKTTFHCTCWEEVNLSKGKVVIPFSPS